MIKNLELDILLLMQNNLNEVKTIYLNTPKELNLQLLFNELKPVFIPKIQFLIHQINYNHSTGGYQIHFKNHSDFLGIKFSELTLILNGLLDNDIIIKTKNHQQGKRSNTYSMVTPFDYSDKDSVIKSPYPVEKNLFLQKWVADNYVVKSKKDSSFIKSSSKESKLNDRIQNLEDENKALREVLAKYEAQGLTPEIQMIPEPEIIVKDPAFMVAAQPQSEAIIIVDNSSKEDGIDTTNNDDDFEDDFPDFSKEDDDPLASLDIQSNYPKVGELNKLPYMDDFEKFRIEFLARKEKEQLMVS